MGLNVCDGYSKMLEVDQIGYSVNLTNGDVMIGAQGKEFLIFPYCPACGIKTTNGVGNCGTNFVNGIKLIADERERQINEEGWSKSRDKSYHTDGELADAAACYILARKRKDREPVRYWPWDMNWWKPTPNDRVRELVKAGALVVAEIERLS